MHSHFLIPYLLLWMKPEILLNNWRVCASYTKSKIYQTKSWTGGNHFQRIDRHSTMGFLSSSGEITIHHSINLVIVNTISPKECFFQVPWNRELGFEGY